MSKLVNTSLIFINPVVRVDGACYCDVFLSDHMPGLWQVHLLLDSAITFRPLYWLSDINISPGSVATLQSLIVAIANFLPSTVSVKEIGQYLNIWQKYEQEYDGFFCSQRVSSVISLPCNFCQIDLCWSFAFHMKVGWKVKLTWSLVVYNVYEALLTVLNVNKNCNMWTGK